MRVAFHDAGGKGAMVAGALADAGFDLHPTEGEVAVVDHDHTTDLHLARPTVLYPHGGNPLVDWDGFLTPHPNVAAVMCHGPGQAAVLDAYGHPAEHVPVGWCYSEVADPRPVSGAARVVFAAPHRLTTGYLSEPLARAADEALAALHAAGCRVDVRRMEDGRGLGHADLDAADLVVADWGTVAHLALARGVPTALYGTRQGPPDIGHRSPRFPASWAAYEALVRYPVDMADGPLDRVLGLLEEREGEVEAYRGAMVGGPFRPEAVVAVVSSVASRLGV